MQEHVQLNGRHLIIDDLSFHLSDFNRIVVAGAGKASASMANGLEQVLGSVIHDGLIVTKHGHSELLQLCQVIEASHPVPAEDSLIAGEEMLKFASRYSGERDLVLFVLSGGASALMEAPMEWVSLEELQRVNKLLLESSATIMTINSVRSKLSRIKMGGLARAFGSATVAVILISDVMSDDLKTIGSGPFVHPVPGLNIEKIVRDYGIAQALPASVIARLTFEGAPLSASHSVAHRIIGNSKTLMFWANHFAQNIGLEVLTPGYLNGSARQCAWRFGSNKRLRDGKWVASRKSGDWPFESNQCVLGAGEPVVEVGGKGLGGRAQEIACVAAERIQGEINFAVLVAGSDGTDGPTDAVGALVDGNTVARAAEKGFTVESTLADNDSYHFHEAAGTLIKTGPTGTNVNDILIAVRA